MAFNGVQTSGVMIPGLEPVPEPDFGHFKQICDPDSNSGSNRSWNWFQSGIGSTYGTGSRAETRSSAGIDSNQRKALIEWQRKYLNRFCSKVSLKSSYL